MRTLRSSDPGRDVLNNQSSVQSGLRSHMGETCRTVRSSEHTPWCPPPVRRSEKLLPTSVSSGSSGGSADPAGPPSFLTSWSWHSGSGLQRRPRFGAGNVECRRSVSCTSARSRRWTRRCWRRRQSTSLGIRTDAAEAFSAEDNRTGFIKFCPGVKCIPEVEV